MYSVHAHGVHDDVVSEDNVQDDCQQLICDDVHAQDVQDNVNGPCVVSSMPALCHLPGAASSQGPPS